MAGSGAYDDSKLGLNKFAKFYYGPGWCAQLRAFRSWMRPSRPQQQLKELGDKDPAFKALHSSYMGFRDRQMPWFRLTEGAYGQYLGVALSARS